jgi:hypothetical protein
MSKIETYYFGQGRLSSRLAGTTGPGGWHWWGDVSVLTWSPSVESVRHRESYSGQKGTVRKFDFMSECPISGTLHTLDRDALGILLNATAVDIPAGAVSAESLGTVAVGDEFRLDHVGVSDLIIVDSSPTPAKIYDDTNAATHGTFDVAHDYGRISCLALPTPAPVSPLKASYSYAAARQLAFLNKPPAVLQLRYEGINLAENGAPVMVEWYRVSSALLQSWALITSGTDVAGSEFSLESLIDSSKPAGGPLGQFGRMVELGGA